jgi:hypothetical protein
MADDKFAPSQEDSKKDTVRINLPPATPVGTAPPGGPATVKLNLTSTGAPIRTPEEKEATAIIGRPPAVGKPKTDTSKVDLAKAKQAVPATPRPTVKLRREPEPAAAAAPSAAPAMAATPVASIAAAPSGAETGISVAAMVLAVAVVAYLAYVVFA